MQEYSFFILIVTKVGLHSYHFGSILVKCSNSTQCITHKINISILLLLPYFLLVLEDSVICCGSNEAFMLLLYIVRAWDHSLIHSRKQYCIFSASS